MRLEDIRVVLVRPLDPKNVGSVCRAMKTMGITSLDIVLGGSIDPGEARRLAHNAEDVLEGARVLTDFRQAVSDAVLTVGTSRRRGRKRKYFSVSPEEMAQRVAEIRGGTVAVLFGNEENGLSDEELAACHLSVHIAASPLLPSLNLSHAVQIVAYALRRALEQTGHARYTPIDGNRVDDVVATIAGALRTIGFFSQGGPEELSRFFHDILGRAGLSEGEAQRLETVFHKICGLCAGKAIEMGARRVDGEGEKP
jgi:tRNA/rRNA methyltransferase